MVYYFACSYPLEPGSIIKKGNWGRMCRLNPSNPQSSISLLKEVVFENVRLRRFSDRPSRFDSVFLCPSLASYNNFIKSTKRPYDLGYMVELVDLNANTFETNWNLISSNYSTIKSMEQGALKYWSHEDVPENLREVLAESDIRIVSRLQ